MEDQSETYFFFRLAKNERILSILVQALMSAWLLSFAFQGKILHALIEVHRLSPELWIFGGTAAVFAGLITCGLFIKSKTAARRLYLWALPVFVGVSLLFLRPPSELWRPAFFMGAFLSGSCVSAWGYYLRSSTPKDQRIKTVADMLILSNILMILLDTLTVHISPIIGLYLSLFLLVVAFALAWHLPKAESEDFSTQAYESGGGNNSLAGILLFLCLFIVIITINSGLMYQVVNPAYNHLEKLTSWFWALPYIVALVVMRNVSPQFDRTYVLYAAIAMIGLSFIGFILMDRSVSSYLLVNTLMMGAFGVYDLFWWSILGEMLEFRKNAAGIMGLGLSANVLGVLLGGLLGGTINVTDRQGLYSTLLALAVICVTLALLPLLHKQLALRLTGHAYLVDFAQQIQELQTQTDPLYPSLEALSNRENQVAALLIQGQTYKAIAAELHISENTVKYYVKNIYAKLEVESRGQLIALFLGKDKN